MIVFLVHNVKDAGRRKKSNFKSEKKGEYFEKAKRFTFYYSSFQIYNFFLN